MSRIRIVPAFHTDSLEQALREGCEFLYMTKRPKVALFDSGMPQPLPSSGEWPLEDVAVLKEPPEICPHCGHRNREGIF